MVNSVINDSTLVLVRIISGIQFNLKSLFAILHESTQYAENNIDRYAASFTSYKARNNRLNGKRGQEILRRFMDPLNVQPVYFE